MMRAALTVAVILLIGIRAHAEDERPLSPAGNSLRPVTTQSLRAVPSAGIYKSAWSDSVSESGITPTSHSVESAASSGESVSHASTAAAQPFFELTQPTDTASSDQSAFTSSETNELFSRLAIWTVIVLCLCVLTVLGLRRWQRRQGILPAGRGNAKILETLALGPGRAVSLVQLGQHQAFVGTDSGGISTIVLAPPTFDDTFDDAELRVTPDNTPSRAADVPAAQTLGFPASGFPGQFTS